MRARVHVLLGAGILAAIACGQAIITPRLRDAASPPPTMDSDTLKVHMKSGDLFLLTDWNAADSGRTLTGTGTRFDAARTPVQASTFAISVDSIALLETTQRGTTFPIGLPGMAVMVTLGGMISVSCLADPKSCFGSCPTFYIEGSDSAQVQAEGFSASIARVLEASDVDALPRPPSAASSIALRMRNEAWETHAVRSVALLAAPLRGAERVFASSDSSFMSAIRLHPASVCRASEGDCLADIGKPDGRERMTTADPTDLAAREYIELEFAQRRHRAGLVIAARHSLVSTFVFYETISYFGTRAPAMLAELERRGRPFADSALGMMEELGGIEIQSPDAAGVWRTVGTFNEAGPIATDTKVIPLPVALHERDPGSPLRLRLRLAKGSWRVDWVALAELGEPVQAMRIEARAVEREGRPDAAARDALRGRGRHLVAMPGDEYRLEFDLPRMQGGMELFLESRGYYYEWVRREWLPNEDPLKALQAIRDPAGALRRLAPEFARREQSMDSLFWASRFSRRGRYATH